MDFSRLPDPVFLKIFEYLPLEDCIRVGRVSKPFRRIAQLFISGTKSLDLSEVRIRNINNEDMFAILVSPNLREARFRKLNDDHLAVILDLCSPNLERIKFLSTENLYTPSDILQHDDHDDVENQGKQLVTVFSNYQCPLLTDIDLGRNPIDGVVFEQLIRNNPNLESLAWKGEFVAFPAVTLDKMKKLNLRIKNGAALQSMIGRFPNLKELDLETRIAPVVFDQFFGSVPQVHQVNLSLLADHDDIFYFGTSGSLSRLVSFWNLPLTSLSIRFIVGTPYEYPADGLLIKVSASFPHLKKLHLDTLDPHFLVPAMASLAALKELEILELRLMSIEEGGKEHDQGIRNLAQSEKLQKLVMCKSSITGGTLINLLRTCPQLEHIVIWEITEVANPEEAAVILESLAGMARRDIIIEFRSDDVTTIKSIWDAEHVKEVIGKLEDIDGLKIKLTWRETRMTEGGQLVIADFSGSDFMHAMTESMYGIDE